MAVKLITIYKRNPCKIYYAVYEQNGSKIKISLKCKNKDEAYLKWKEYLNNQLSENTLENKSNQSVPAPIQKISISDATNLFLTRVQTTLQASTFRSLRLSILKFTKFLNSRKISYINQIKENHIFMFLDRFETEGKSNKTINNYVSLLNNYFKFMIRNNYIIIDFKQDLYWKKKVKKPLELFNKTQARIIIERIKLIQDSAYRVMLLSPFFTGMRYSELKALNKKNIDLCNRIIHVKEKQTPNDLNPINSLKTNAAYRKIPILKEYLEILKVFIQEVPHEYIFAEISYKRLSEIRRKLAKEIEIPFRFHDARHFFASLLINNKYDFKTIQVILGHEDIRFTFNVYGHIIDSFNAEEFDRIVF